MLGRTEPRGARQQGRVSEQGTFSHTGTAWAGAGWGQKDTSRVAPQLALDVFSHHLPTHPNPSPVLASKEGPGCCSPCQSLKTLLAWVTGPRAVAWQEMGEVKVRTWTLAFPPRVVA